MMNDFYEILDLIYRLNKKYPDLRFGQIIATVYNKNIEDLFYLSDEELYNRLNELLNSE